MENVRHTATYKTFLIHTIIPAPEWRSVWWFSHGHEVLPLHALALVTCYTRNVHSNKALPQCLDELEEDRRTIVGLEYNPIDGWGICDEFSNFCGLLPPGWTLVDFEAYQPCPTHTRTLEPPP